jgi:hypothetical protein
VSNVQEIHAIVGTCKNTSDFANHSEPRSPVYFSRLLPHKSCDGCSNIETEPPGAQTIKNSSSEAISQASYRSFGLTSSRCPPANCTVNSPVLRIVIASTLALKYAKIGATVGASSGFSVMSPSDCLSQQGWPTVTRTVPDASAISSPSRKSTCM